MSLTEHLSCFAVIWVYLFDHEYLTGRKEVLFLVCSTQAFRSVPCMWELLEKH